ncbi:MAG: hypothetical protein HOP12_05355 [Candidatus Eisenbacteria bacterium]|uniref:DUF4352 domain-containing protein n=1 Tax=Eiseniibacteriota bacterium TaxID=2212470 RepID=A0A849SIY9_UNCEI|nr:hypothetical protein [Candidatus Eisenbacteria bacterium]
MEVLIAAVAPLAMLGTAAMVLAAVAIAVVSASQGRPRLAAKFGLGAAGLLGGYLAVLVGVSLASPARTFAPGAEFHFAEFDPHFHVRVLDARREPGAGGGTRLILDLAARSDAARVEQWPSWVRVRLLTEAGGALDPATVDGVAPRIMSEHPVVFDGAIAPRESMRVQLAFELPSGVTVEALTIDGDAWPSCWMVGNDISWFHKPVRLLLPRG